MNEQLRLEKQTKLEAAEGEIARLSDRARELEVLTGVGAVVGLRVNG